ncbi:hypothetical protein CEE36_11440 [candidate division TA06 bacterium B3_TA06]|uniref:Uncharacterized protein n=1 Tax=candidate division TA06 bacterium B3_TA06 TaxID=2012487 RepID=A0A532UNV2_UNCT6|nr:MAG: hypothetical protein CEE36_11440 [candidate division TA06 bacterium B3_TA06]
MPDINAEELLEKAWDEFRRDYDERVREYSESLGREDEEKAKKEHWILWNEADLMVQLGRYTYDHLARNSPSAVEMHFEKNLTRANFEGYDFEGSLDELKKRLKRKQGPKVDLIIVQENSLGRFLLCAEAKFFHCSEESISRGKRTAKTAIEKDIETLVAIRDLGIAERVIFILFDDYYWIRNEDIESFVENACKEHKIIPLMHNSKAKVEPWK